MADYNQQPYNPVDFEEEDDLQWQDEQPKNKSIVGYRIVIIILAVVLAALSMLYYNVHRQQQRDYELLRIDRDSIQSDLGHLIEEYDNLQLTNDTMVLKLEEANKLMEELKRERSWNLAKIKQYEKEVGTLRTVMKGYLRQIDSLNQLNKKLIDENVGYRKTISSITLRAEVAEEKAAELNNIVRQGSVLRARDISLVALNERGKEITRVKNAARLRADFVLSANELANPGERTVYLRIISPDGYPLSTESVPTFEYEGERVTYSASRDIDYQNEDLGVSIYYAGRGFTAGTYTVQVYCDGYLIGSTELSLR